jgi:hypothetical protein
VSFDTQTREQVQLWAHLGALVTTRCEWCDKELRPCNLGRHIMAKHFRQLTIFDVIDGLASDEERAQR